MVTLHAAFMSVTAAERVGTPAVPVEVTMASDRRWRGTESGC